MGLFTAKPPVTRVVIDLDGPQAYQVFPSGRTVIVRIGSAAPQPVGFNPSAPSGPRLVNSNYPVQAVEIAAPAPPPLVVSFKAGKLTINSNKASLSEVLFAVHQRTGADIAIPAGAEQEKVVAQIGPGSAPEVLSRLLTGTRFNFLILSTENDPGTLDRVILSARPDGPGPAVQPLQQMAPVEEDPEAEAPAPPPRSPHPIPTRLPVDREIPRILKRITFQTSLQIPRRLQFVYGGVIRRIGTGEVPIDGDYSWRCCHTRRYS